jgi:hypothetical protein
VLSNPGLEIVMRNPFPDLMKRKVVQWSLAYGAVAVVFVEVLDIVGGRFRWPPRRDHYADFEDQLP